VTSRILRVQTQGSPPPLPVEGRSFALEREKAQRLDIRKLSRVSEQWMLVETYERDGKQYILARCDDTWCGKQRALSPRESQALGFAVLGDSNKVIAYKMGISASTVGVLLHRAAGKLDCHSRPELLVRFLALGDAPTGT
jgi:DNA-binding CsgD family transcriptional regulator